MLCKVVIWKMLETNDAVYSGGSEMFSFSWGAEKKNK